MIRPRIFLFIALAATMLSTTPYALAQRTTTSGSPGCDRADIDPDDEFHVGAET